MKPRDPDFPEEIPAIPDPVSETPGPARPVDATSSDPAAETPPPESTRSSAPLADTTPALPPAASTAEIAEDDQWTELDEADPNPPMPPTVDPVTHPWSGEEADHYRGTAPAPRPDKSRRVEARPGASRQAGTSQRNDAAARPQPTTPTYDIWAEEDRPYQPQELGLINQLVLVLADGATLWRKLLRGMRSLLPVDLQRRLGDEVLTAIVLGVLVLLLALWNPLRSPAVVNSEPAGPGATLANQETETDRPTDPGFGADSAAAPTRATAETASDQSLSDQSLIEAIQTQVSRLSRSYAAGLIQSVEVNLPASTLTVNVSTDWYGLGQGTQDAIAQDIYDQAQGLAFQTLRLRDANGVIVARNPVVGNTMVVLKRIRATDADLLAS